MDTRKPKVMLLGTFHFEGSSDIVQIKSGQLTSDKKQQEIADVVEKITKFSYELMARGNRVIAAGFFIL